MRLFGAFALLVLAVSAHGQQIDTADVLPADDTVQDQFVVKVFIHEAYLVDSVNGKFGSLAVVVPKGAKAGDTILVVEHANIRDQFNKAVQQQIDLEQGNREMEKAMKQILKQIDTTKGNP